MIKLTTVVALFLAFATFASAYTGADQLVKDCTIAPTKPKEAFNQVQCISYISGVLDTYGVVSGLYSNVNVYCAPREGVTVDNVVNAVVQWVRNHPDMADSSARSAILLSLKEKYPCR